MTKTLTVMAALLLVAASAHAQTGEKSQTVTFTDINDAVPDKFFDAASSVPDLTDPNALIIGLNSGRDFAIWKDRDFKASLLAYSYPSATDTISFVIHAPDGYYISTVTYDEKVVLSVSRTGRAFAVTQLVVNGVATDKNSVDLSALCASTVPMSITTSLVSASADARVLGGRVVVSVLPLPVPPEPEPPVPEVVPVTEVTEVVPEVPEVPVVPDVPVVEGLPEVSEVPGVPVVPEVPALPVVTEVATVPSVG